MSTLPPELTNWSVVFAPLFSKRVWSSVQVLLSGAILAIGTRTVTALLRVMGLGCGALRPGAGAPAWGQRPASLQGKPAADVTSKIDGCRYSLASGNACALVQPREKKRSRRHRYGGLAWQRLAGCANALTAGARSDRATPATGVPVHRSEHDTRPDPGLVRAALAGRSDV